MNSTQPRIEDLPALLQPGDVMLYAPSDIFGRIIALKTWCADVCHVETYMGDGVSAASRNGLGVNTYSTRYADLSHVLRPVATFYPAWAWPWHRKVCGQKYDWMGLLVFFLAVKQGARDRMFCSEHATRLARAAGIEPFNPDYDADRVAPADFLKSDAYDTFWTR